MGANISVDGVSTDSRHPDVAFCEDVLSEHVSMPLARLVATFRAAVGATRGATSRREAVARIADLMVLPHRNADWLLSAIEVAARSLVRENPDAGRDKTERDRAA